MQIITLLNQCYRFPGFVYQHVRFSPDRRSLEVRIRPRVGSRAICSGCHRPASGYDHLADRQFEFIPVWGYLVFLLYRMRRVDCKTCGVIVEEGKPEELLFTPQTDRVRAFLKRYNDRYRI